LIQKIPQNKKAPAQAGALNCVLKKSVADNENQYEAMTGPPKR
jgi:hypothetical protein